MRLRSIESVADGEVNSDLEQIVLKNDEADPIPSASLLPRTSIRQNNAPSVDDSRIAEDALEDAELLHAGVLAASDTPVVGVERTARAGRPDDRAETHGVRDRANTVVYAWYRISAA